MRLNKLANLTLAGLALTLAVSGCKTKPQGVRTMPGYNTPKPQDITDDARLQGDLAKATDLGIPSLKPIDSTDSIPLPNISDFDKFNENADFFKGDTVHFAYDSSVVKNDEETKVASVAEYLKANAANALRIEGHCDERGTEEYNRSLGERRAIAVREKLIALGIAPGHILTATFGKDRPVDSNHEEGAWNKNRRGEFVLLTPPK
jgi:peptidoglycan-associated lipoprotein